MAKNKTSLEREQLNQDIASNIHDKTERCFALAALEAGLAVLRGPAIRCRGAVKDRYGRMRKTVTTPDFEVRDPADPETRTTLVEVTSGRAATPSKEAQKRVIERAKITNYVQVTGFEVDWLASSETPQQKRSILDLILNWDN